MKSITLKNITHTYGKHTVLHDVTLSLPIGKMIAICGPSGCGKTTLLNIIGLLERPSRGSVQYDEMEVCANSSRAVKKLRYTIGFLFQNYGLSDNDTVLWNMMSAMEYVKTGKEEKKKCIAQVLEKVGLYGIEQQKICQLSGGEQQRVALAKLMVKPCELILADEPTGNLDSKTTMEVLRLMQRIVREQQQTLVMVTHDNHLASYADRRIRIVDGKITGIETGGRSALEETDKTAPEAQQPAQMEDITV